MATNNIRQREDGIFEARFTYKDSLGVSRRKSIYAKTKAECKKKLKKCQAEATLGIYEEEPDNYTVAQWMEIWMQDFCINLKPTTRDGYQRKIDRYIVPLLGTVKLSKLTSLNVQRFCNMLSAGFGKQKPLAPKSVSNVHGILHSAMKRAMIVGLISKNPADLTELPKVKKPALKPLMDADIKRYRKRIAEDKYGIMLTIDLYTGLRRSELIGLKWCDVDLDNGIITVCRQIQKIGGQKAYIEMNETKNGKSREVPISTSVVQLFKQQKKLQAQWKLAAGPLWCDSDLVFTDELGNFVKHHTLYSHHKAAAADIGLPECRLHDLRHSFAILAMQSGVDVKSLQSAMGHYSSSFTMDVYGGVSDTMKQDTKDKMEAAFKSSAG